MRPDERDLDDEIRGHLAIEIKDRVDRGVDPKEARLAAIADLGHIPEVRDSMRRVWYGRVFDSLEGLRRDARFGARVLRKSPGFTLVAVATLALAIATNTIVFGLLNGIILHPLNVPQPDTLFGIQHADEHSMYESYPDYRDLRDRNRSFDGIAGYQIEQVAVDTGGNSSTAWGVEATGNFFDALQIRPYLGRVFHAADERGPGSAPYVVLAYDYWHKRFQDDSSAIGRVVRLNTHSFTVIGVTPPDFRGTLAFFGPDLYVPFVDQPLIEGRNTLETREAHALFQTLGHLKPGVAPDQAAADLNAIGAYLESTYPTTHGTTHFAIVRPGLYGDLLGPPMRAFLAGLTLLSILVLLAACANLGSLFAARAADRSREVALRLSLGASRGRVLRQLLTEALLVSLVGGALGLWMGAGSLRALTAWQPIPRYPMHVAIAPDGAVYGAAFILAVVSGLLFGLVPARQVFRTDPYQIIKAGPSGRAGRRLQIRDLLLIAEVAICGVLVTASIVAVRGLSRSLNSDFGFRPDHALLAMTDLGMAGYAGDKATVMQKRMIESVASIPGVAAVGVVGRPPLNGGGFGSMIFKDAVTDLRPTNAMFTAERYQISPDYLDAAGTALLAGRAFSWHDDKGAPRVALVNRDFARKLYGGTANAVGSVFKLRDGTRVRVVGVVEDGKYQNLTEDQGPALFVPMLQMSMTEMSLVVRATGDPAALASSVRERLRTLDSALPLYIETWNQQLGLALFPARMATIALGIMGVIGAMLAVTGIFGMAAYAVSRRMKELGIRIALGARRKEVLSAALGRALRLLAVGSVSGLLIGLLAARVLAAIVYQATPRDPIVLGGVIAVMAALGLLATWIPAQRALGVSPLRLLRED